MPFYLYQLAGPVQALTLSRLHEAHLGLSVRVPVFVEDPPVTTTKSSGWQNGGRVAKSSIVYYNLTTLAFREHCDKTGIFSKSQEAERLEVALLLAIWHVDAVALVADVRAHAIESFVAATRIRRGTTAPCALGVQVSCRGFAS